MKIIKKFFRYCLIISINIIILFGLKMILPVRDNDVNNSIQQNMIYLNK